MPFRFRKPQDILKVLSVTTPNSPAEPTKVKPLRFTNVGSDVATVSFTVYVGANTNFQYRRGTEDFTNWNFAELSIPIGEYVEIVGNNLSLNKDYMGTFVMTGTIAASGSVMTLIYGESCTEDENLILPIPLCYLFRSCASLVTAPELPATTIYRGCYFSMFNGCTSLKKAPKLPATTLKETCYQNMFYGCTSLEEAPELPATTLTGSCYYGMFRNCSALKKIKVYFTEWKLDYTNGWAIGLPSTGTFYKPTALPEEYGTSRIPDGWNVVNID